MMEESDEDVELLSASELVTSQQTKQRPDHQVSTGFELRKTLEWTGCAWEPEEVERRLEAWLQPSREKRVESLNSLSVGEWDDQLGQAVLSRWTGKHFEFMGSTVDGKIHLKPEEALYLLECSQLELLFGDVPMSIQRAYSTLLGADCSLAEYLVYSQLMKAGYRVVRHQGDLGITSYERLVGLDHYQKKTKMRSQDDTGVRPLQGRCIFTGSARPELPEEHQPDTRSSETRSDSSSRVSDKFAEEREEDQSNTESETTNSIPPGDICYRCLRKHKQDPERCFSLNRRCRQCGGYGHFANVHREQDPEARKFILDNLRDPRTGNLYTEHQLWDGVDLHEGSTEDTKAVKDNLFDQGTENLGTDHHLLEEFDLHGGSTEKTKNVKDNCDNSETSVIREENLTGHAENGVSCDYDNSMETKHSSENCDALENELKNQDEKLIDHQSSQKSNDEVLDTIKDKALKIFNEIGKENVSRTTMHKLKDLIPDLFQHPQIQLQVPKAYVPSSCSPVSPSQTPEDGKIEESESEDQNNQSGEKQCRGFWSDLEQIPSTTDDGKMVYNFGHFTPPTPREQGMKRKLDLEEEGLIGKRQCVELDGDKDAGQHHQGLDREGQSHRGGFECEEVREWRRNLQISDQGNPFTSLPEMYAGDWFGPHRNQAEDNQDVSAKDKDQHQYLHSGRKSAISTADRPQSSDGSRSTYESSDSSDYHDDVSAHSELKYLKQSALGSLWSYEGEVGPLISPEMAESMRAIFARIQVSPDPRQQFKQSKAKPLKISFDCYKSSSTFKKSLKIVPDYRVVVSKFDEPVPDSAQLIGVEESIADGVPLLFAVVNSGTVLFTTMRGLRMPTLYEDEFEVT